MITYHVGRDDQKWQLYNLFSNALRVILYNVARPTVICGVTAGRRAVIDR